MDFIKYFEQNFLNQNLTVNQILSEYDGKRYNKNVDGKVPKTDPIRAIDTNIKDGKYSKEEVSIFIEQAVKYPLKNVLSPNILVKLLFKIIDKNPKYGNNDNHITIEEFDKYLQSEFNTTLDSLRDKSVPEACKELDKNG